MPTITRRVATGIVVAAMTAPVVATATPLTGPDAELAVLAARLPALFQAEREALDAYDKADACMRAWLESNLEPNEHTEVASWDAWRLRQYAAEDACDMIAIERMD